jgi:hypothetical protein
MRAAMKLKPGATSGSRVTMPAVVVSGLPSIFHSLAGDGDHAGLPAPTIH